MVLRPAGNCGVRLTGGGCGECLGALPIYSEKKLVVHVEHSYDRED
jgi:hypothetical protein